MRKSDNPVVAIACADIHLSHTPPIARAGEEQKMMGGWYEAMARPLRELKRLKEDYANCPILCAGDIFHHWKSPPELINFALEYLPKMVSIAGQHDLPNHVLEDIHKSAFGTLVQAGTIHFLSPPQIVGFEKIIVKGFSWGTTVGRPTIKKGTGINVCLHHAYRWISKIPKTGYANAPADAAIDSSLWHNYREYDVVIFGDNHTSWEYGNGFSKKVPNLFNCGSLMRRNSDQINHRPRVGLIHLDGSVESHYLDCSKDIISATAGPLERACETPISLARLQEQLKQLQGSTLDFIAVLRQTMDREDITPEVRQIIEEAIEGKP